MLHRVMNSTVKFLFVVGCTLLVLCHNAEAAKKVIFVPFDGTNAGRYAYLTDSVSTMVASRVSGSGEIEVADYSLNKTEIAQIRKIGDDAKSGTPVSRLQGDYLISGGLYEMQAGLQIQVTVYSLGTTQKNSSFSTSADAETKIIPAVEEISHLVSDYIHTGAQTSAKFTEKDISEKGTSGFATEHPDKSFKKGITSGSSVTGAEGYEVEVLKSSKSGSIANSVVSIAVGDMDRDGVDEIVMATRSTISVYHLINDQFHLESEYSFGPTIKIHAINMADLDKSGVQSLYVSANSEHAPASAVLVLTKGKGLQEKVKNIPWFIRPMAKPKSDLMLLGQRGSEDPAQGYVGKEIYQLAYDKNTNKFEEKVQINLPKQIGLFDFEWADLDGSGAAKIVAIDSRMKLLIYNEAGKLLWISSEEYGGGRNFMGPALSSDKKLSDNADDRDVRFIPARLIVYDFDGDGKDEVIVSRNKLVSTLWLKRTREFDGGSISCLSWNNSGMTEIWRTQSLAGYVADYGIIGLDSGKAKKTPNQSVKLVIGQVPYRAILGFMMKESTVLHRYELNIKKQ